MVTRSKISEIVDKIVINYQPDKIILFGSYAKRSANDESDVDFIIVKNTNKPKHKRGGDVRRHLLGSLVSIDLKIYTPSEFEEEKGQEYSFLNSALENSEIVYERKK
jgi:uncharacterized protein